ncbi:HipA domain-containing protein [Belliella sp. DSM 111904]|uniref:HipA domain-containing protein n=1 Tax=Belliella filtrata TaxID=2923435 RepID=A0ABS9UX24_9BACT|nr:HipA domain-containing protein [Belliella filtrata]MCH7408495.1 HipA domain-containing protein [Belliella filtrata]
MKSMLRRERYHNNSGEILNESKIKTLKSKDYIVLDFPLDGDAPKQFIKVYEYLEDGKVKRGNTKTWNSYIAKTAEKWYPHESIIEYMINKIGEVLGLNMNEVKLVKANGQIRFLSKYFLNPNEEKLVHGAEICSEYLGDYEEGQRIANNKGEARKVFTFEFIKNAIRNVFPQDFESILRDFVSMLVFDALVGNNDRHFYNWGVIQNARNTNKRVIFAPLYDSARGLLWNFDEDNIKMNLENYSSTNGRKVINYIKLSKPRVSIEDNKKANHIELIEFVKRDSDDFKKIVKHLSNETKEKDVIKMLEKEIFIFFSKPRIELIKIVLSERFKLIRNA